MSIKLRDLSYTYAIGGEPSLVNINLEVPTGTLMVLTGASGSGKSTILRAVAGLIPSYYQGTVSGSVEIDGRAIGQLPLAEVARTVGFLNQNPEQGFFALSVREELLTSLLWQNVSTEKAEAQLAEIARKLGIENLLDKWVSEISAGQKQKVALASLIINPQIRTLVLDEPSANLDKKSALDLAQILGELGAEGYTILLADHRLYWLAGVADSVVVLKNGKIVVEGSFDVVSSPELQAIYELRATELTEKPELMVSSRPPLLTWDNLHFAYGRGTPPIFEGFSGSMNSGICALIGENGSGKSTLARLVSGLREPKTGSIAWGGKTLRRGKRQVLSALVPQNVDRVLYTTSVLEEVRANAGGRLGKKEALAMLASLNLDSVADRHPQSLSGGQKQRLACASVLASDSGLLILDEPTSGLDATNMRLIGDALKRAVASDRGVLLISHDEEMLNAYADSQIKLEKIKS